MGEAGESRSGVRTALPYLLGVMLLLLMLIPQLALHFAYHLLVRAALAGLVVYLAAHRSARQGILFALAMGALAWLMDLDEGAVIALLTTAGVLMALVVGNGPGPVCAKVALGCLIGAAVLVGGVAGMMLWRKESDLLKALQFGALTEWHTIAAALVGGMTGAYVAKRK